MTARSSEFRREMENTLAVYDALLSASQVHRFDHGPAERPLGSGGEHAASLGTSRDRAAVEVLAPSRDQRVTLR